MYHLSGSSARIHSADDEDAFQARVPLWLKAAGVLILLTAVGGAWYFFLGSKPAIAFSAPIAALETGETGAATVLVISPSVYVVAKADHVYCFDTALRRRLWMTRLPTVVAVLEAWRDGVVDEFLSLQTWERELQAKRARLSDDHKEEIVEFNAEAKRYHEKLTAARARAASAPVPATDASEKPKPGSTPAATPVKKPGGAAKNELKEKRSNHEAARLTTWKSQWEEKKAAARTKFQQKAAQDEEERWRKAVADFVAEFPEAPLPWETHSASETAANRAAVAALTVGNALEAPGTEAEPGWAELGTRTVKTLLFQVGNVVWIATANRLAGLDLANGSIKANLSTMGRPRFVCPQGDDTCLLVDSGPRATQLFRIPAKGQPVISYWPSHSSEPVIEGRGSTQTIASPSAVRTDFHPSPSGIVRLDSKLLKANVTEQPSTAASESDINSRLQNSPTGSSSELTAMLDAIQADAARGSGPTMADASTYEVRLSKPLDPALGEWKGEVGGWSRLATTGNLIILATAEQIYVFDHHLQFLWESRLAGSILDAVGSWLYEGSAQPFLEVGDRLLVGDSAFLTAHAKDNGLVRWRIPVAGAENIVQTAASTVIVVGSAPASEDPLERTVTKVDIDQGKVLWKQPKFGGAYFAGSHLYAHRIGRAAEDVVEGVFGKNPVTRWKLYKLSLGSGADRWEWFQPKAPRWIYPTGREVVLLFDDEFQVVRSFAF